MKNIEGKKTYLIALACVVVTVIQCASGEMSWSDGVYYLIGGSALASVRSAMNRIGIQVNDKE